MMRVNQDPKNKKTFVDIENLTRKHKKAIRNANYDIGRESQNETRKSINNTGKTGKLYKIGNRVHRASSKGQAPANLSGKLKRSVDYSVRGHKQSEFGYKELYGKFLEDGTKNMGERPNIKTVGAKLSQAYINYIVEHFRKLK